MVAFYNVHINSIKEMVDDKRKKKFKQAYITVLPITRSSCELPVYSIKPLAILQSKLSKVLQNSQESVKRRGHQCTWQSQVDILQSLQFTQAWPVYFDGNQSEHTRVHFGSLSDCTSYYDNVIRICTRLGMKSYLLLFLSKFNKESKRKFCGFIRVVRWKSSTQHNA